MIFENIVLITKYFPYSINEAPAENYLISELPFLAEYADRVYVVATDASEKSHCRVKLPANVTAFAIQKNEIQYEKFRYILKAVIYSITKKYQIEDYPSFFFEKIYWNYLWMKSTHKIHLIRKIFSGKKIVLSDKTLVYSFWFYDYAKVAIDICDQFCSSHARVISRAHGYDLYEERHLLKYIPLRGWCLERMHTVYPCSKDGEKYLSARYPKYKNRICAGYLGTGNNPFIKYVLTGTYHFMSCSRVVGVKRVERIVEGLAELEKEGFCVKWTHIGNGNRLEKVRKLCKNKLKETSWELLGRMENKAVLQYIKENNIYCFLNVSKSEGIPISIMEAMSFGIPVIATKVGGVGEIIEDGLNGFLLPENFSNIQMVEILKRIMRIKFENYLIMRREARNIWEKNFSIKRNLGKLMERELE